MAAFASARPPLKTKFSECYSALLSGNQPWAEDASNSSSLHSTPTRPSFHRSKSAGKSNSGPRTRYYADLLCLPVETRFVVDQLEDLSPDLLLSDDPNSKGARIRENMGSLWREAIRVWRESDEDEVRRKNAVDTLMALSYPILSKKFSNYSFDVITIFAGGMDEADEVFTLLVDSIDDTLRGGASARTRIPSSIRDENDDDQEVRAREWIDRDVQHRALQLGLLWLARVAQTSLAAYFLRRDLFVTASTFIGTPQGAVFAYEGALLLGLLATVGQGSSGGMSINASSANPYARRFRDWVDQDTMEKILIAASTALERSLQQYIEIADDAPPTIVRNLAGLASMRWMSNLTEMVSPVPSRKPTAASPSGDFSHLPIRSAVILLPLYLLSRSNQAFTSLILDIPDGDDEQTEGKDMDSRVGVRLYCHLVSLTSYLATHASVSARSGSYARIALLCLLIFLYDPRGSRSMLHQSKVATQALENIRICRQREPALSYPRKKRLRLITANLDVATCSLRYNLSKRLDVPTYLISLKIIQRSIVLCSEEKVLLEYDWDDCWSAVLNVASFLAARYTEMRNTASLLELVKAVVSTLNSALIRSDQFLASTTEVHHFIYELVRMKDTLRKMVLLLDPTTTTGRSGNGTMSPTSSSIEVGLSSLSLTSTPIPPKLYALLPGWKNLERVTQAVESKLHDWVNEKPSSRKNKTPDISTVLKMIAALDLEHLLAGGAEEERSTTKNGSNSNAYSHPGPLHQDLEWLDRIQEKSLPEFVRCSGVDVLRILPIY